MIVYGIAKNPYAPTANTSAGTATTVYAVYKSPPSRNQVISVPKRRPPNPHSCRCVRSAAFQREATKPSTDTSRKKNANTPHAVQCTSALMAAPAMHDVRQQRGDGYPGEHVPVEEW